MQFSNKQIEASLYDLIFQRINEDLNYVKDLFGLNDYDIEDYRSNYNPTIKIHTFSQDNFTEYLALKKEVFIKEVGEFEIETFKDVNNLGYELFSYEVNLFLECIERGKAVVERFENEFHLIQFKFPNDLKMTPCISEKNLTQLKVYFKNLISSIDNTLREIDKTEVITHNIIDEELYQKSLEAIKIIFNEIDLNKQWQYCFLNEDDFNCYIETLANYFVYDRLISSDLIIQVKRRTKSKLAKTLRKIYNHSTEKQLKDNKDFYKLLRVLSVFTPLSDEEILSSLSK